jgi:septum site-determining protein MinD
MDDKMNHAIAVVSGKGGVGKTTLAANLGVAMTRCGLENVTLVDAALETPNLGFHFGAEGVRPTLCEVFMGEALAGEAVHPTPHGVNLVPAGLSLDCLKHFDNEEFERILDEVFMESGIAVVDVQTGLGSCVLPAIKTCQHVLLVVNPEVSSMADALKTKHTAMRLGAHVLGAVLNRVKVQDDGSTDMTVLETENLLDVPILSVIPEDPEVRRCTSRGQTVVMENPHSPAAAALMELARRLVVG